ncbi:exonuclease domain-containing protein [Cellulomonas composti]|uniref:BRCT domain-containing protein n=1 Tax=Cellulomonas composti TaxID=266130 RepID=A0A511J7K8_9CELL|nr:exonuclease domain-containing protein [Cellulomonas composti]GEL93699.1 hypothetical protein CCO02nite_03570 [Cellulomonas composti]
MALNFTSIDFETANSTRSSVCAVGMARVRDGRVVETYRRLVCPPQGAYAFTNTWIHGIGPEDVVAAPTWDDLLPEVVAFIGADVLVAHNASFDGSVFSRASQECGCAVSGLTFVCTLRLARALLALGSYSLPFVAHELGLPAFDHHEAGADAGVAAEVAVALAARAGVDDIDDLADLGGSTGWRHGARVGAAVASVEDWVGVAAGGALDGEAVCFTGTLRTMQRSTAQAVVAALGGRADASVTKSTSVLVAGELDPRTFRPGATMSAKLAKAFRLAGEGQAIRVMTEAEFLEFVDITPDEVAGVKTRGLRSLS